MLVKDRGVRDSIRREIALLTENSGDADNGLVVEKRNDFVLAVSRSVQRKRITELCEG